MNKYVQIDTAGQRDGDSGAAAPPPGRAPRRSQEKPMTRDRMLPGVLLALTLLVPAVAGAASKAAAEEAMSAEGLQKIKVKGVDLAYARPGASLAAYTKVRIAPVQVAFRRDFDPNRSGSRMRIDPEELERIRADVAKIVQEAFARELARGSYAATDAAGAEVLDVRANIVDLYVNAPDTMEPGRTRTYTVSAGEMTLVMELADSASGEVLARVYDRREARDTGQLTWTNRVTNQAEAERIAAGWARILRARLDAARGIGK
jgi:hypothetical protein